MYQIKETKTGYYITDSSDRQGSIRNRKLVVKGLQKNIDLSAAFNKFNTNADIIYIGAIAEKNTIERQQLINAFGSFAIKYISKGYIME